jgi:CheY-like chemotaxis protein
MESPKPAEQLRGLLLSDDLIFTSRITGTARDLGYLIRSARSADVLSELFQKEATRCVIIDLANPGLAVADLVRQLRAGGKGPCIVAYGSHVDADGLRVARQAGCDVVLPRSQFVKDLAASLPNWFAAK